MAKTPFADGCPSRSLPLRAAARQGHSVETDVSASGRATTTRNIADGRTERLNVELLLKRAYEKPARSDGFRVLVDRLWPRGVSKDTLRLNMWAKAVSPSTTLRKWFAHDPDRWQEFEKRYKAELKESEARQALAAIVDQAKHARVITLVYGAKDTEHNEAVVLRGILKRRLGSRKAPTSSGDTP